MQQSSNLTSSASFRQLSTLEPTSTQDKHSKVTLSEWNIGLLDGLNRLHQVPGLRLEYWWSCTQHGSKPQWSHMLECKQRIVNHEHGVVRVVPGGVQHVRFDAGGCRALASLLVKFHATSSNLTVLHHSTTINTRTHSTQDKHSKVTLSEWNIGLLDGLNRLHQVPGLQLEYWWSCAQHGSKPQWSHMLECKQRMVNHEHGVVRVVPGGVQHVRLIAGGCRALASLLVKFHATSSNLTVLLSFRQLSTLKPTSTQDKHSKVTLSEWNIGLLDGLNRLHQVPGLQLEYWWSCAQHGSKPQWSHMLECKQRMVNHEHGVVRVVPGGV
ncbi:hypothetical protein DFH27DRAFT_618922 [Peziza echinospora]|nr:hypothetical protein DFH27DRAFT_618922 [Peziza echinospora]